MNPIEDLTDTVKKDFILFLTLFLPFGILIVAMIITIRKLTGKWKTKNT